MSPAECLACALNCAGTCRFGQSMASPALLAQTVIVAALWCIDDAPLFAFPLDRPRSLSLASSLASLSCPTQANLWRRPPSWHWPYSLTLPVSCSHLRTACLFLAPRLVVAFLTRG